MGATASTVLVIHGPNLNLLGTREPEIYGSTTLPELDAALQAEGAELGLHVRCVQANGEGEIIDHIHAAAGTAGLVINPGGYTHTSVAIADALRSVSVPAIEVHLSNLYSREPMRHTSLTATACVGVVMGFGVSSYHLALRQLARMIGSGPASRPAGQAT
jgi:3-dehydroquinate dehydratase-2